MSFVYDSSCGFILSLVLAGQPILFDVSLGYSNNQNTSLAGFSPNGPEHYRLANFKIDKVVIPEMLMYPNQDLAGKPVMSFGIETGDGKLLYFQVQLSLSAMEKIDEVCAVRICTDEIDYHSLYRSYLTVSQPEKIVVRNTFTASEVEKENATQRNNTSRASVLPVTTQFPKHFFTGNTLYEEVSGRYGIYDYAYYSSYFVGTDNVVTFFIGMRRTMSSDYGTQIFYCDYVLDYNTAVLYNPTSDTLQIWEDQQNAFSVSAPTVVIKCNNANGCIIKREMYAYIGTSTSQKIARAAIQWVEYLSTIVATIDELTATEINRIETYGGSMAEQYSIYGMTINQITAEAKPLGTEGDHLYLEVKGSNIPTSSVTYSLSFTVRF